MPRPYDPERLKRIPIEELITPKDGHVVIMKSYWQCIDGSVLGYINDRKGNDVSPLCNKQKEIVERFGYAGTHAVFIELAYWPQRL